MKRFLIFLILVVLFVFGLYRWNESRGPQRRPEKFTPAERARIDLEDVKVLAAMEDEYTRLVEAVVPSVVSIYASKRVRQGYVIDPFELWFRGRYRAVPREREARSLGSGVIVSKEGHIVTNHHVVAEVDEVRVQLSNGREAAARVIGSDEQSDIAVLKIDENDVIPMPFGDSDKVKVGQRVVAVGNPFGLEETVTQGIISAKGRRAMQDSANEFFQTDAAINPGNSGGPLVNLRGEIIGINSSIYSGSGGWQGVGFAIPSNTARRIMESILNTGRVVRGYLGIVMQPLTPELARQFGQRSADGVLVAEVLPDSPADRAGVRAGDVIVKFNGRSIEDVQALRSRVAETEVDAKAEIVVRRGDKETTLTAQIAEQPANFLARQPGVPMPPQPPSQPQPPQMPPGFGAVPAPVPVPPGPGGSGQPRGRGRSGGGGVTNAGSALAGVRVTEIPPDHRADLPSNVRGVMVTEIHPSSPAAESLQEGDVIEEINRQPIASVEDFERVVRSLQPGERQMLFIARGRTRSFVMITPG